MWAGNTTETHIQGQHDFVVSVPETAALGTSAVPLPMFGSGAAQITLFDTDQSSTLGNEALPFRATTYEPKSANASGLNVPPNLLKGQLYVQDPMELSARNLPATLNWNTMPWAEMYARGLNSFLSQQQRQQEAKGRPMPTPPPDFEAEDVTDVEAVSRHISGIATSYAANMISPEPYELYEHMITQLLQQSSPSSILGGSSNQSQHLVNSPVHRASIGGGDVPSAPLGRPSVASSTAQSSRQNVGNAGGGDSFMWDNQPLMSLMPTHTAGTGAGMEVLNFAMLLSNPDNVTPGALGQLEAMLERHPTLALRLPASVVDALIQQLRDHSALGDGGRSSASIEVPPPGGITPMLPFRVMAGAPTGQRISDGPDVASFDRQSVLCSILTHLVLRRKQLGETLQFALALDSLTALDTRATTTPSPHPATLLPMLPTKLIHSFTFGPFGQYRTPSPLDVLHGESTANVSVSLPEGVSVSRFCVSHDEKHVAFVATDMRILICDAKTWEVVESAPNPNNKHSGGGGCCWCVQFSLDDTQLLVTDGSGKHHTLLATQGLSVVERFHFDSPRLPRFLSTATRAEGDSTRRGHRNSGGNSSPLEDDEAADRTSSTASSGLSFLPAPLLPSGKSHVASLRFLTSERMNFPLPHQTVDANHQAATTTTPSSPNTLLASSAAGVQQQDQTLMDLGVVTPQPTQTFLTTDELCMFAIVDSAFHGVIATIDTGDELLSLQLRGGLVLLVHGGGSCQAVVTPHAGVAGSSGNIGGCGSSGWVMACASWKAGLWTLFLNGEVADLRGMRMTQSKSIQIVQAYGLCGTGHIASVAAWCGPPARETLRDLVASNILSASGTAAHDGGEGCVVGPRVRNSRATPRSTSDGCIQPLFHLPLDEGSGLFLKEMVSQTTISLNQAVCVWDSNIAAFFVASPPPPPATSSPTAADEGPRLPAQVFLAAHVHQSRYGIVLSYPTAHRGTDGGCVLVLSRDGQVIESSYSDPNDIAADTLFHVNWEETKLFSFVSRFGAFAATSISSARKRREVVDVWLRPPSRPLQRPSSLPEEERLDPDRGGASGEVERPAVVAGTIAWLAERIHRVLYIEGTQLLRFPAALSPINARNMVTVCAALRHCTRPGTPKIKILSLLTLGAVHFRYLSRPGSHDRGVVQSVAAMLNMVCKQLLAEHGKDRVLSDVAAELFHVGVSKSLTPVHKAEVLAEAADTTKPQNHDIIESYLARDSIGPIVEFLVREDPAMLKRVAGSLLRYCDGLEPGTGSNRLAVSHLLWFTVAVTRYCSGPNEGLLREIFEMFIGYALSCLRRVFVALGGTLPSSCNAVGDHVNRPIMASSLSQEDDLVPGGAASSSTTSPSTPLMNGARAPPYTCAVTTVQPIVAFDTLKLTAVHTAVVPFLVAVSHQAPQIVDDALRRKLSECLTYTSPPPQHHGGGAGSKAAGFSSSIQDDETSIDPTTTTQNVSSPPHQASSSSPRGNVTPHVNRSDYNESPTIANASWTNVSPTPPSHEAGLRSAAFSRPTLQDGSSIGRQQRNSRGQPPPSPLLANGLLVRAPPTSTITFSTRQACDVVPVGPSAPWRLLFDVSFATSVSFTKETAAEVTLLEIGVPTSTTPLDVPTADSSGGDQPSMPTPAPADGESPPMSLGGGATAPPLARGLVGKKVLSASSPSLKVAGGKYLLYGVGEASLTVVCHYALTQRTDYRGFLRDAIFRTLISVARHCLVRPPPCDVFLAPLFRHGLANVTLLRHNIKLEVERSPEPTLALEVLRGEGGGKDIVDTLIRAMRGVLTASMRPSVQALLAILIHTGVAPNVAQEEVKARWFSGEWGSKLQGEDKEPARKSLVQLAEWIILNVSNTTTAGCALSPIRRSSSSDRRASDFLGRSMARSSLSSSSNERRGSGSQHSSGGGRRSTSKAAAGQNEVLEQVRALFTKGITPSQLESLIIGRTEAAISITRGLAILAALVAPDGLATAYRGAQGTSRQSAVFTGLSLNKSTTEQFTDTRPQKVGGGFAAAREGCTDREYGFVLDTVSQLLVSADAQHAHLIEGLVGCGGDLEQAVRREFHVVVAAASRGLLEDTAQRTCAPNAQVALCRPVSGGASILKLMGLLCHPWDSNDCDFLMQRASEVVKQSGTSIGANCRILSYLEELSQVTTSSTATARWGSTQQQPLMTPVKQADALNNSHAQVLLRLGEDPQVGMLPITELLAIADEGSLSCIFPNNFGSVIPGTQISRSDAGIVVERTISGIITVRADEAWPLEWCDGLPRVYYFETTLLTPFYRASTCLAQPRGPADGPGGRQVQDAGGIIYAYTTSGAVMPAHDVGMPPYHDGDTVGLGIVPSTRRVFFTLNGVFLGFSGTTIDEKLNKVYPALTLDTQDTARVAVNFGTQSFLFDFRQLHPSMLLTSEPSAACIASTAASVLHVMTARACTLSDLRRIEARNFFLTCTHLLCVSAKRVTDSLACPEAAGDSQHGSPKSPGFVQAANSASSRSHTSAFGGGISSHVGAVRVALAETQILKILATLKHVVRIVGSSSASVVVEDVSESVFKAVTTLMLLPLQSVKIATIALLPEVLPLVAKQVKDGHASAQLVRSLFELAKSKAPSLYAMHRQNTPPGLGRVDLMRAHQGGSSAMSSPSGSACQLSPQTPTTINVGTVDPYDAACDIGVEEACQTIFAPSWLQCDTRCMTILNTHHARMAPETQRSIVLGSVLPRTGTVSFTIRITREGMTKGHSLKGGYFVGVALATLAPLSPPSNSQSWKVVKPPIVWALHDTSPQLPHAVNPTVRPNNFQRTFGSGDIITVVVNRDAQTVSFYRDDVFLKELYQDVPQHMELAPFAQLYNDDASVDLGPGLVTPAITAHMLLSSAAVDVLRTMFSLHPFDDHVARHLTEELDTDPWPAVTLAVFSSLPDPRALTVRHTVHDETAVVVRRVYDSRCKFTVGDSTYYDHLYNLRTPAQPTIRGKLNTSFAGASITGVMRCIEAITRTWSRLTLPLVTTNALEASERIDRRGLLHEERAAYDALFVPRRMQRFESITNLTKTSLKEVARSPPVPLGYAFSQPLSHPGFVLSPRYCGRLVTVPNGSANTTTPFIAIAEPSIPASGRFSIRCQLIRGHHGQILGGGYYFGVCASSFTSKRREMNANPPDVWALHDMEDAPWRLRHLTVDRRLPTAAEPNCLLVSGDIVRLEIDRDEGTVHAYRKPVSAADEIFIGFLYDNLPKNTELFPFVHMYNTDAVAVMLPSSAAIAAVRTTVQQPRFALCLNDKRNCDGCVSQHRETKLSNGNQDWYKCNECVDYNLCGYCFGSFVHSHHPFTRMDARLLVHTRHPPMGRLQPGVTLVAPGTSALYLKSCGCTIPEDSMSCVAVSTQPESMCTWGLIYSPQEDPSFTVNVKLNDILQGGGASSSSLSTNRPVFIGVGEASDILNASVEELRKRCVTGFPNGISICSDSRVRRKLSFTSVSPHGFLSGSTITVTIQFGQSRARITRDWIDIGFAALPPNMHASSRLVGFVLFGSPNMTASVAPERSPHTLVTVADVVSNDIIRVSDPSGIQRFCGVQDCRVPVIAETAPPKMDRWYYAFADGMLSICRVAMVDKGDVVVFFPKRDAVQRLSASQLFVPVFGDVPNGDDFGDLLDDTCAASSAPLPPPPRGPPPGGSQGRSPLVAPSAVRRGPTTIMDGFVISRLLVILSCLMEDASLVPLLQAHANALLPLLHRLASVRIESDAPTSFLPELRAAVANTAQVPRTQRLLRRPLAPFIPTTTPELEKTHAFPVKPNMLVAIIDGPLKGKLFRAHGAGTDTFRAEPLEGGQAATIKAAACVPVKQTAGRPWWRVPGGLPSSVLEHTLRSEVLPLHTNAKLMISTEGEWHGELITAQNANMSMSLSLRVDTMNWQVSGTARVTIPDGRVIETTVRGGHQRYARTVKLVCSYPTAGPHMTNDELRTGLKSFSVHATTEATRDDMLRKLSSLCVHLPQPCWTLKGMVDAEGLRMAGTWKHTEGLSGTFSISSLRGITLAPLTTPLSHVEPLPNCSDTPIPPPQPRDVYTVMHRLIVLLARHLYVTLVGRSGELAKVISKEIIHYHAHPLTERLIAFCVDTQPQRFYRILGEAIALIMNPKATPWDSSTLSAIITKSILLRPSIAITMPSIFWDALHAVVAAAHNCGEDHRHKVMDNVIQLIRGMAVYPPGNVRDNPTLPPPSLTASEPTPTADLLTALCTWVDVQASTIVGIAPVRRDVAAGIELLLTIAEPIADRVATSVPLPVLRCLMNMAESLQNGVALPQVVEASSRNTDAQLPALEVLCPFGQFADGELKVGKIMSSLKTTVPLGRYYFEAVLPERSLAAFAVGWGTQQHSDIPSQHVGSDLHSFAFSGSQVVMKQIKEEYKTGADICTGAVVGCLLDLSEKTAAWSVNGVVGPFITIPINLNDLDVHAFVSTGSCSGMRIHMSASQFLHVPDGYCDLAGRTSGVQIVSFDPERRSLIPVRPIGFYAQVASYQSDIEAATLALNSGAPEAGATPSQAGNVGTPAVVPLASQKLTPQAERAIRSRYSQLAHLPDREMDRFLAVIRVAESCMTTARRFIDLEGENVEGRLASAFLFMKQLVTRTFRRKLVEIPAVETVKGYNPPNITVRYTELFSTLSRSTDAALHHTILAQLYRQIGAFTPKQFLQNPMVRVHLYMTQSGHAPQDMGGPYRQLWSLLGDELMTHPDACYPHTEFHRNPLFRFANNSQRISLVPDHNASSTFELHLFTFLGKLMGHMARARSPLPLDISPFVWKFLVEDPLSVKDYYQHVDSVVEQSVNDEEFLLSEVAEDVIPNYADAISRETELLQHQQFQGQLHQQNHTSGGFPTSVVSPSLPTSAASSASGMRAAAAAAAGAMGPNSLLSPHVNNGSRSELSLIYDDTDDQVLTFAVRRRVAEECLTHCMDNQLAALREGLWSTLPKRVTRCLCWQDLERSVCGEASPTVEQLRDAVTVSTHHLREQFFWRLMEEMTGAQRSAFLCFACGQKRLPLVKKVRVTENTESLDHLPRAQSCSALVTVPCYTTYEVFRTKVLAAIEHQSEMELA